MAIHLIPILIEYVKTFYSHRESWLKAVRCLAELDCYCSMAICSGKMENSCRPELTDEVGVF